MQDRQNGFDFDFKFFMVQQNVIEVDLFDLHYDISRFLLNNSSFISDIFWLNIVWITSIKELKFFSIKKT